MTAFLALNFAVKKHGNSREDTCSTKLVNIDGICKLHPMVMRITVFEGLSKIFQIIVVIRKKKKIEIKLHFFHFCSQSNREID